MTLFIYTDGASSGNPGPMGIGIVLWKQGRKIGEISEYIGKGTNNIAEYTAVVRALELALELAEKRVIIRSDSELVVKQLNGAYKVKDRTLKPLYLRIKELCGMLNAKFEYIQRERNITADKLSKDAIKNADNK